MIELRKLMKATGASQRRLTYLRSVGLIPKPKVVGDPENGGSVSYYPDETLPLVAYIQRCQREGMRLPEIAASLEGTTVIPGTHEPGPHSTEVKAPLNGDLQRTVKGLMAQVGELLPDREIVSITVAKFTEEGQPVLYVAGAVIK